MVASAADRRDTLEDAGRHADLRRESPGGIDTEPQDHGLGRSRGGLTTIFLIHFATEQGQKPLSLLITVGHWSTTRWSAASIASKTPRRGHEIRQARGPLRNNGAGRSHERAAVTSAAPTRSGMPQPSSSTARITYRALCAIAGFVLR